LAVSIGRFGSACGADMGLQCDFFGSGGDISRIQTFKASFSNFRVACFSCIFRCFDCDIDSNYFITNILIYFIMAQVHLLFANKSYDTSKQVLTENQIVIGYGYAMSERHYCSL
jgi:hypothetical protein